MTNIEMMQKMFEEQDKLNTRIIENYRELGIPWYRAIWIECAEMLNHTPWKWWSKGDDVKTRDIELELVDIWHFGMSDILSSLPEHMSEKHMFTYILTIVSLFEYNGYIIEEYFGQPNLQTLIEKLAARTLTSKHFDIISFVNLCKILNLDIRKLYKLYMGKNVLNRFRQDHGYKTGTYVKMWSKNKEDNDYMLDIINSLEPNDNFAQNVYDKLAETYKNLTSNIEEEILFS